MVVLAALMRRHELIPLGAGRVADFGFLDEMGALMVWGTALLFIDCILIILLYEHSRTWLSNRFFARLALAGAVVLSFDQAGFYLGLWLLTAAPDSVLIGGLGRQDGRGRDLQRAGRLLSALARTPDRPGVEGGQRL